MYARGYGMNVFHNLMTLTGWMIDYRTATPDLFSRLSTTAWRGVLWLPVALAILSALAWRTTRLPAMGLAWWLLALGPVLPLLFQRYLHYVYVPLAGLTIATGAGFEWLIVRWTGAPGSPPRSATRVTLAWALAAGGIAAHAAASDALIEVRAAVRLPGFDLPADPFFRKAETARRVVVSVRREVAGRHARIVFVIPESAGMAGLAGVLHSILGEGLALRAVFPNLDSVAFVRRWSPAYEDFEVFYSRVDGNVVPLGRGPSAQVKLAMALIGDGCIEDAREGITAAVAAYPEDPDLRALRARLPAR
jgi:hypothetical protein